MKAAKIGNWIKVDGTIVPVVPGKGAKFRLEELQEMVGGYVERLRLPDGFVMIVNEDGIPMGLPPNEVASQMARTNIVGDVVVLPRGMGW
jgi:uncharacterized protein DUF3846